MEPGTKHDSDKIRPELLIQGMPRALEQVCEVLTFGAEKYDDHNWLLVENAANRYWGAKLRHELARAKSETHDKDSGLLHLAHEATNVLLLLELELLKQEQTYKQSELPDA